MEKVEGYCSNFTCLLVVIVVNSVVVKIMFEIRKSIKIKEKENFSRRLYCSQERTPRCNEKMENKAYLHKVGGVISRNGIRQARHSGLCVDVG